MSQVVQANIYPLNVTGGTTVRVAIKAPPRGSILKAQVIQFSGGKNSFTSMFFNSAAACPPDPLDNNGQPAPVTPPVVVNPWAEAAGQIGAPMAAANNQDRYMVNGVDGGFSPVGVPYANADGGVSDAKGFLYLKLQAGGSGALVFGVFLNILVGG